MTPTRRSQPTEDLRALLRAHGLRATNARLAVLGLLGAATQPLSHASVMRRLPAGHDRTTIHRVLGTLARVRLVRRMDVGDRVWRYARTPSADHGGVRASFVCTECSAVTELRPFELATATRSRMPQAIARGEIDVLVRGVCDRCML